MRSVGLTRCVVRLIGERKNEKVLDLVHSMEIRDARHFRTGLPCHLPVSVGRERMNIRLCGLLNCQYYDNAERCVHAHRLWLTCRRCGRRAIFSERELVERPPLKPIGIPKFIGMDKADAMGDKTYIHDAVEDANANLESGLTAKQEALKEFFDLGVEDIDLSQILSRRYQSRESGFRWSHDEKVFLMTLIEFSHILGFTGLALWLGVFSMG